MGIESREKDEVKMGTATPRGITGLLWREYAKGRTLEEEPRRRLIIALYKKQRNNKLNRPTSVGETRQSERNHPLDVVSHGLLNEEYHSAWSPNE
jgi:hypothetical protein